MLLPSRLKPCEEATKWLAAQSDPETAWNSCKRTDWMIWLLNEINFDNKKVLRLYACWCARNTPLADGRVVWDLLTDTRSRNAVEVSERFANGEANQQELGAAWDAARDAASDAAWAAASAAASDAAWAAASAAAWAAASDAAWAAQADQLRSVVPFSSFAHLLVEE